MFLFSIVSAPAESFHLLYAGESSGISLLRDIGLSRLILLAEAVPVRAQSVGCYLVDVLHATTKVSRKFQLTSTFFGRKRTGLVMMSMPLAGATAQLEPDD